MRGFGIVNKAFDCVDHKKLWKNLKEMGIPYHLTCLLSWFLGMLSGVGWKQFQSLRARYFWWSLILLGTGE